MRKKTTVVNVNSGEPYDVYVGRSIKYGGPSKFGNPFKITKDVTREESVAKYKIHFHLLLLIDKKFKSAVEDLKGLILACHCTPLLCHADVIAAHLNGEVSY